MEYPINQRINEFFKTLNISKPKFAEALGYDRPQTTYNVLEGKHAVGVDFVQNLLNVYKNVSSEWLLRGEGKMFKSAYEESHDAATEEYYNKSHEDPGEYINIGDGSFEYEDKDKEIARLKGVIYGLQYSLNQMIKHKDEEKQDKSSQQTADFPH